VIDTLTDNIITTVGDTTNPATFTATGHAFWLDTEHFAMIDRVNRAVKIFRLVDKGGVFEFVQTSTLNTKTSLHAIERMANPITRDDLFTYYALNTGDLGNAIAPSVSELRYNPKTESLSKIREVSLDNSLTKIHGVTPKTHHANISPDGQYLYVPVFDGKVYIIDRASLKIKKVLDAKLGAAHVEFSAQEGVAVVTNHYDNHITIIDLATQTVKKHIKIGEVHFHQEEPHLLQPHFSYISKDGRYYYTFASQDGDFIKIDLQTLEVVEKLQTGGAPEQAHS
jgi:DNA-binding beta-propeller fold protein YncE